jgi:hypothetical protein
LIDIDAVDEYAIRDKPVLVQPPPSGAYTSLPFWCRPLNTPPDTVPVSDCVVTGEPGTSASLNAIVDDDPLLHEITSLPLIGAVGGIPSVLQFSAALCELTNLIEPPLTLPEHPLTGPEARSTVRTLVLLVSFGSVGLNIPVPLNDLQMVPLAAPAGAAPITPIGNAIAISTNIPTILRIVNAPLTG